MGGGKICQQQGPTSSQSGVFMDPVNLFGGCKRGGKGFCLMFFHPNLSDSLTFTVMSLTYVYMFAFVYLFAL